MTAVASNCALVLGAGGGLGSAIVAEFLSDPAITRVFAVSSQGRPAELSVPDASELRLVWVKTEYNELSMSGVVDQLQEQASNIGRVCICHGLLHSETIWPEKRLEDINEIFDDMLKGDITGRIVMTF